MWASLNFPYMVMKLGCIAQLIFSGLKETGYSINSMEERSDILQAGIDEAGRGPLFGSVFAGVCIMPPLCELERPELVKDSKKFSSRKRREEAAAYIKSVAVDWGVGEATSTEVDAANIGKATIIAMHRAVANLTVVPDQLLVDGNRFDPYIRMGDDSDDYSSIPHQTVVGGDAKHLCIAAASIIAKCAHDAHIADCCSENPSLDERYGLLRNMGYGTEIHRRGLQTFGPSSLHRLSFSLLPKTK